MKLLQFQLLVSLFHVSQSVLELGRDKDGNSVWKEGHYRNRNVVPRPEVLFEKKHKRDTEDVDVKDHIITHEVENDVIPQNAKKSKIFGKHFSLPIGAMLPLGYSGVVDQSKSEGSKKSKVPRVSFSQLLSDDPTDHFGIVDALGKDEQASSRSDVPVQTWGLVQRLHKQGLHDENGSERSSIGHDQINEEDLSGLMEEGLSGQRGRERMEIILPEYQLPKKQRKKRSSDNKHPLRMF